MLISDLGHGEHQKTPKQNQLSQEREINKTQINWEIVQWKIRFQNKRIEKLRSLIEFLQLDQSNQV